MKTSKSSFTPQRFKAQTVPTRSGAALAPLAWYEDRVALVLKVAGSRGGFTLKTRQHERREYHDTKVDDLIPTTAGRVRHRLEKILEKA